MSVISHIGRIEKKNRDQVVSYHTVSRGVGSRHPSRSWLSGTVGICRRRRATLRWLPCSPRVPPPVERIGHSRRNGGGRRRMSDCNPVIIIAPQSSHSFHYSRTNADFRHEMGEADAYRCQLTAVRIFRRADSSNGDCHDRNIRFRRDVLPICH